MTFAKKLSNLNDLTKVYVNPVRQSYAAMRQISAGALLGNRYFSPFWLFGTGHA
jgi:hypothetical protein